MKGDSCLGHDCPGVARFELGSKTKRVCDGLVVTHWVSMLNGTYVKAHLGASAGSPERTVV